MLTEERKKLKAAAAAHAFNMKTPLVTIAAADLDEYVLP